MAHGNGRQVLEQALRQSGGQMVTHHSWMMAANFGSAASEAAVCRGSVGIADRCDYATFELHGEPAEIDAAILAAHRLGDRAWWTSPKPRLALLRCDWTDAEACAEALAGAQGAVSLPVSDRYAAIELIGPLAENLLDRVEDRFGDLRTIVLRPTPVTFELLIEAERGAELWQALLVAGGPLHVACVGFEALEHLAASGHVRRRPVPVAAQ